MVEVGRAILTSETLASFSAAGHVFVLGKKDREVNLDEQRAESAGRGWVQDVFGLRSLGHDRLYIPACLTRDQTPRQVTRGSRTRRL
jgi:hypothetical protein